MQNDYDLINFNFLVGWISTICSLDSVHGIMFKDLKKLLRKEQCDASSLLTANVPSAKNSCCCSYNGL